MANKPFAIQGADLTLGGVNLQAGTTGVVIPGVTRAASYKVEEVNDTEDQTYVFAFDSEVVVVDYVLYNAIVNQATENLYADFTATTDGEGYIDNIKVNGQGTYTSQQATDNAANYMYAYVGTASASDRPLVPQDWINIPFRPKMRAGAVENIGGGGNANTGNFTFSDDTINNGNGLILETDRGSLAIGTAMEGVGNAGHFHIAFDGSNINSPASDLFLGDDYNYVKLPGSDLNPSTPYGAEIGTHNRDGGNSNTWRFGTDGGLTFPDDTVQTTAYTGQSGSSSGELYVFANADGNLITSTDGITWSNPLPSGVTGTGQGPTPNAIGKLDVHGGVIVYTRADIALDTFTPMTGLYYSTVIGTATLCAGTDALLGDDLFWNEVHYFAATARWVAVGYSVPNTGNQFPVVAHSLDGITWTVVKPNNTFLNDYLATAVGQFTDVIYNTISSEYVISAVRATEGTAYGGMFVTSDITVALDAANFVDIETNVWRLGYWPYVFFNNPGYIFAVNRKDDNTFGLWVSSPTYNDNTGLLDPANWSTSYGWYEETMTTEVGYVPNISEVAYNNNVFIITTIDGQVFAQPNAPATYVTIPLAYTSSITDISRNAPLSGLATTISFTDTNNNGPKADGEKIVISGVTSHTENNSTTEQSYNGVYYIKIIANGENPTTYELYTDQTLATPWDTSTYWPVDLDTGTLTWSHGEFLDAAGAAGETIFVGNDNEQVFRSTYYGQTWTQMADVTGHYFNDFAYGSFGTGGALNELVNGNYTVSLDDEGNLNLPDDSDSSAIGRIQTLNGYPTLLAYGAGLHGGPELDWMDSDNATADFNSNSTLRHTMYLNGSGLRVGMNENEVPGEFSGHWNFNTDGSLSLPAESNVGSFVNNTSGGDYNIWYEASVTGPNGTVYAIGGEANSSNSFIVAQTKTGTLWRKAIDSIDLGDGNGTSYPYGLNIKFDVAHELLYVGFEGGESTGVISIVPATGAVDNTWVLQGSNSVYISQRSFTIDSVGDPIIVGNSYGGYITRNGVTAGRGTDGNGNNYVNVALSAVNADPKTMDNTWQVDIDGAGTWVGADFNSYYGIPAVYNGTPGAGGLQVSTEGTTYSVGAVTGSNGYGIDLDASLWNDTAMRDAVLAQTSGVHFTVVIGSLTPGVAQTVLEFSSVSDWSVPTGTVYHMDGNWTVTSGTGNIDTAATDIMSITYGTVLKLNLYTYINRDNGLIYSDGGNSYDNGTNYQTGETLKILGSLLGGRDGGYITTATVNSILGNGTKIFFDIATYPTLDVDVPAGSLFRYNGVNNLNQTVVSIVDDNEGSWEVTITGGLAYTTDVEFFDGNDYQFIWRGNYAEETHWLPAENIRLAVNQTITSQSTYNVREQEGQQAFVWTPNWAHKFGSLTTDEYFRDVVYDSVNNRVIATGRFNQPEDNSDGLVIALDNADDGATLWQKFVGDNNVGNYGYSNSVGVDPNGNVITVGTNDNGQAMITKLNGATGSVIWQTVQTNHSNWNNNPKGVVDDTGDVYFGNTYYNNDVNHYMLSLVKLNGSNGELMWAKNVNNAQDYWMYEIWYSDHQTLNLGNGQIQWAGYVQDINNDRRDAVAVSLPQSGTVTGEYGRWIVTDDSAITLITGNDSYVVTPATPYTPTGVLTFTSTTPSISLYDIANSTTDRNNIQQGGGSIVFPDGSDISQAGITRALKDTGDNLTTLDFEHNGKFLYFYGSNGSSTVRVPQNNSTALPIGYTVTMVIDNFDTSNVYVNTSDDTSNGLHISAVGFSQTYSNNNYWRIGNDGNVGIYTIMKVDTNRWVLSGPSVQDDY